MPESRFRFSALEHAYFDLETGDIIPHVTGMLMQTGWIDDSWYTDAACERGTAVHAMTSQFDLGVLDPDTCDSPHRGFLLAYVKAVKLIRPEFEKIEVPMVHPVFMFGGRADRVGKIYGMKACLEIKSCPVDDAHPIQLALQCVLESDYFKLPPEMIARFSLHIATNGKAKLLEHTRKADFAEARRIIKECCGK